MGPSLYATLLKKSYQAVTYYPQLGKLSQCVQIFPIRPNLSYRTYTTKLEKPSNNYVLLEKNYRREPIRH